jgi:nicotinate phosphoribosyltransferase
LDETVISELKRQGAKINVWGVGTHLVTAANQPALDGVYKLSMVQDSSGQWIDRIKLSEQSIKISNPGRLQVRRFLKGSENLADMIFDTLNPPAGEGAIADPLDPLSLKKIPSGTSYRDLLQPIFIKGKKVYDLPRLEAIRERTQLELSQFHAGFKRFLNPHRYIVGLEKGLYERKTALIRSIRDT